MVDDGASYAHVKKEVGRTGGQEGKDAALVLVMLSLKAGKHQVDDWRNWSGPQKEV